MRVKGRLVFKDLNNIELKNYIKYNINNNKELF